MPCAHTKRRPFFQCLREHRFPTQISKITTAIPSTSRGCPQERPLYPNPPPSPMWSSGASSLAVTGSDWHPEFRIQITMLTTWIPRTITCSGSAQRMSSAWAIHQYQAGAIVALNSHASAGRLQRIGQTRLVSRTIHIVYGSNGGVQYRDNLKLKKKKNEKKKYRDYKWVASIAARSNANAFVLRMRVSP